MRWVERWKPTLRRAVDTWRERNLPAAQPIDHRYPMPALDDAALERLESRLTPNLPYCDIAVPKLPQVPGMITEAEGRYLYGLTSQSYTGSGAVVEVGTWMGRSSLHLAAGLRDSGYHEHLHCFDKYEWRRAYEEDRLEVGFALDEGADFMPYFERNVRPEYPGLRVDKASIDEIGWDRGPIEILHLDAPKTYRDVSRALAHFSSHLIPGLSTVVLQDYLLPTSYCIAMLVAEIPGLAKLHVIPESTTVSFVVNRPIAVSRPLDDWRYDEHDLSRVYETWDRILAPLDPDARCRIEPGLTLHLHERGEVGEAIRRLRQIRFTEAGLRKWRFLGRGVWAERYPELFRVPLEATAL